MVLPLLFGFISGIGLGSFFHFTFWFSLFCLICSGTFFLFSKKNKKFLIASIFIIGLLFGVVRISFSNLYSGSQLDNFANKKIVAEGIVVDEPDTREYNTKLTIRLSEVYYQNTATKLSEKILVTVPLYPEFSYGDKVKIETTFLKPKEIESEGERVFDYGGYLRARGIWYTGKFAKITFIENGHGAYVKYLLFKIKHAFTDSLNNAIPEPESSLMSGLLLGTKQSLGKDLLSEFQRSGVSHVVVLSGYNIAIVATSIMSVLSFLPKAFSFSFGIISIILFTILSGGGASSSRAAIMVLVALIAKKMNRDYKASRALGFAIVLMLAPNPLLLVFDPSFQLSALATIGLIFVSPFVVPYMSWLTEKWNFREIVSSTIATQITVLPFLIYNTGLLSIVSLPVNILILGTIPTTMFLGFITGIIGLFSLYLSFIPALFAYVLLWYQLTIVHIGATLPFGAINIPAFSPIILFLIYGIIFVGLYKLKRQ